jgi:hypothetical protein
MFNSKNVLFYVVGAAVIITGSYLATQYKKTLEPDDEYDLIKKYLLNDSPLYGYNRPKIWIHSKYEINSRKWKDFYSRNTTDLNQPYIHLTIKTIINHCGSDFNVCLIDDETFSKLIPSWDVDLTGMAEPMKSHFRQLGLAQLVYYYGGMVVPNSFCCTKSLSEFYKEGTAGNRPFFCEAINRTVDNMHQKRKYLFLPDMYFMGALKNNDEILELVEYLKKICKDPHFSSQVDFRGDVSNWLLDAHRGQKINLIGGEAIGVKTADRKQIVLDNLMEEDFLNVHDSLVGIYIPEDEILTRPKFQWFAVMPSEKILQTKCIISKYLMASIVDSTSEYYKSSEIKSVVSI